MSKRKTILLGLVSVLLLSSCGSIGSNLWYKNAERPERVKYYKEVCSDYGHKYGTSNMSKCVATEMREKSQRVYDWLDGLSNKLHHMGDSSGDNITCQSYGTMTNCRKY